MRITIQPIPQRLILIPCGKWVTLGEYVKQWKLLKTMPPDAEVTGWEWYSMTVAEVLRAFSRGVEDRINAGVPRINRGSPFTRK